MAQAENPTKFDITAVFKRLRALPANQVCFDCGAKNPTWASVTYGVLVCLDCSSVHRGLGVHVSFIRSTQLDTNWTWLQLRAIQLGGNATATQFFRAHGCTSTDAQQKYKSRAATLYRDKLHHLAVQAMRLHGTKLHLDTQLSPGPGTKEVDFFEAHSSPHITPVASSASLTDGAYIIPHAPQADQQKEGEGPRVFDLIKDGPKEATTEAEAKKPALIGQRKPAKAGAKKGGMGAQKINANFAQIEQQAQEMEAAAAAEKEAGKLRSTQKPQQSEPDITQLSARLQLQDVDKQRTLTEQRLRASGAGGADKAEQVERLGIGFKQLSDKHQASHGVGHSVSSGVQAIRQEGVAGRGGKTQTSGYGAKSRDPPDYEEELDDDWEYVRREPGANRKPAIFDEDDYRSDNSSFNKKSNDEFFDAFETVTSVKEQQDGRRDTPTRTNRAPRGVSGGASAASEDAQKKFGNAKAISSDQYFGNQAGPDYETRTSLARFEGASAIGSADFFGGGGGEGATSGGGGGGGGGYGGGGYGASYTSHLPELADVKDSMRTGVTKVGSKLSNIGASVSNYIQDRYS